ncbi:COP23 domain-containing protein [Microcoleus sp. EPA2]|uniref:COP23 domain-containing protein n=1 Tax=Microcoleus sp. EPA2 TaxID=2841654 RepID=UPI00312B76B9
MKSKLIAQILLSALAVSGTMVTATTVQAGPATLVANETTVFQCVGSGRNLATIAKRGNRTTDPIILWRTTEFGREFTPSQRCQAVSRRLTQAVANNGGSLSNLLLTTGTVNSLPVVCFVSGRGRCNSSNTLFTLDRKNASNPGAVLTRLVNFAENGVGQAVVSRTRPTDEPEQQYVSLQDLVDRALNTAPAPVKAQPSNRGI